MNIERQQFMNSSIVHVDFPFDIRYHALNFGCGHSPFAVATVHEYFIGGYYSSYSGRHVAWGR
jgi:hypothetical protein